MSKKFLTCVLALLLLCVIGIAPAAFAEGSKAVVDQSDWQDLTGEDRYIQYHDNYHLDIEKTGLLDAIDSAINGVANIILSLITALGFAVCNCFYFVLDFDLAALFAPQLDSIQTALKSSVFDTLFVLAFAASLFGLAKQLAKRNISGLLADLGKVLVIMVLSILVTQYSAVTISGATSIAKGVGMNALADLNGQSTLNVSNYSSQAAGLLWKSLVHQPWESLEFIGMDSHTDEDVEAFLTTSKNDDAAREALVASYSGGFSKKLGGSRVGLEVLYLIVFAIKALIFLALAIIQLGFQALAVFVVLLAPVILLLSLIPAFGGVNLIGSWFRKLLETQIMVFLVMLLVGLLLKIETLMYGLSASFGWLSVMIVETFVFGVLALNYKTVLGMFKKAGTMIQYPAMAQRQLERTDLFSVSAGMRNFASSTQRQAGKIAVPISNLASSAASHVSDTLEKTNGVKRPYSYAPFVPETESGPLPPNPGNSVSQHVRVRKHPVAPPASATGPMPPEPATGAATPERPLTTPPPAKQSVLSAAPEGAALPLRPTTTPLPAGSPAPAPHQSSRTTRRSLNLGEPLMADDFPGVAASAPGRTAQNPIAATEQRPRTSEPYSSASIQSTAPAAPPSSPPAPTSLPTPTDDSLPPRPNTLPTQDQTKQEGL